MIARLQPVKHPSVIKNIGTKIHTDNFWDVFPASLPPKKNVGT